MNGNATKVPNNMSAQKNSNRSVMRRFFILIAISLVTAGLVVYLIWSHNEARRAIYQLSESQRQVLYNHTLENIKMICAQSGDALQTYCKDQAKFLLNFPECDQVCEQLARSLLSPYQAPR